MKRADFEQLVYEAIEALPEPGKKAMENVVFVIEEKACRGESNETGIKVNSHAKDFGAEEDEALLGLYEGIPKIKRGAGYSGALPDKITIFQKPIEDFGGGDIEKIKKLVYEVVWHEVGHHLGFDEKEIRALETKRNLSSNC